MSIEEQLKYIQDRIKDHEQRLSLLEANPKKIGIGGKKLSIKEFILSKNPKDDLQRTLVIAYYLENYDEMKSFNVKDLSSGFEAAREQIPSNLNVAVNLNIEKGYLMATKDKKDKLKAWTLTNTGGKFVGEVMRREVK